MSIKSRRIHKETMIAVGTGLMVNYPTNLFLLFVLIDLFDWTNSFYIGTTITAIMTVIAYCRVYIIRRHFANGESA
tara:strand:+ start:1330 stop:1557 length:228 start_codon:yes stop_codon:yes gene_type:complete